MMLSIANLTGLLAFSGMTTAHLIMANPKPYGSPDNSPLTGSNYPCKLTGDPATFYSREGLSNTATAGGTVKMSFQGSAVHGGGSCQVALTTDKQPSASTRWSVILSIEGGCPSKDGSGPSEYDVKIPDDIAPGDYSYAWTWTSRLSGQPEYYMNCAPLTIQAGSKTRRTPALGTHRRAAALDAYPPLAVYNLAGVNDCKSKLSSSPQYPVPGKNVERLASSGAALADLIGTNCFAKGVTFSGSTGGGGGVGGEGPSEGKSGGGGAGGGASDGAGGGAGLGRAGAGAGAGTGSGSGSGSGSPTASSPSGFATSVVAAPPATAPGAGGSSGAGSGASSGGASCTLGQSECTADGKSYKSCLAGGQWSVNMPVAPGTKCAPGVSTTLSITASAKKRHGLPRRGPRLVRW